MAVLIGTTDTTGGSADSFGAGEIAATKRNAAVSGSVDTVFIVIRASGFTSLRIAIYSHNSGTDDPSALLGVSDAITSNTVGEHSAAMPSPVAIVSGTDYWLGILPIGGFMDYTSTAIVGNYDFLGGGFSVFPDPWGTTASDAPRALPIRGESSGAAPASSPIPTFNAIPFMK